MPFEFLMIIIIVCNVVRLSNTSPPPPLLMVSNKNRDKATQRHVEGRRIQWWSTPLQLVLFFLCYYFHSFLLNSREPQNHHHKWRLQFLMKWKLCPWWMAILIWRRMIGVGTSVLDHLLRNQLISLLWIMRGPFRHFNTLLVYCFGLWRSFDVLLEFLNGSSRIELDDLVWTCGRGMDAFPSPPLLWPDLSKSYCYFY